MKVLKGDGTVAQNEVIIANAGVAIHCTNEKLSLADSMEAARESLQSKKALNVYNKLIAL